jgi:hypothetical protein
MKTNLIEKFLPIEKAAIRKIPTFYTDQVKPDGNNDVETFAKACAELPATLEPDYDAAMNHAEMAQKCLLKAKQASTDGNADHAKSMTSLAMHHAVHMHHAIKGAHYTKEGNHLSAARNSTDVAKMLCTAKVAFDHRDLGYGRSAIHPAIQRLSLVASGLARAKLARPLEDVEREQRLSKCMSHGAPTAQFGKCW